MNRICQMHPIYTQNPVVSAGFFYCWADILQLAVQFSEYDITTSEPALKLKI